MTEVSTGCSEQWEDGALSIGEPSFCSGGDNDFVERGGGEVRFSRPGFQKARGRGLNALSKKTQLLGKACENVRRKGLHNEL